MWKFFILSLCALTTLSCGIKVGGGSLRDPVPNGTLVASGEFQGQNGKTVSGSALVYQTGQVSYVLRLSGVSFPAESGQQIFAVVGGSTLSAIELRGNTGDQNYDITLSGFTSPDWQLVRIHSTVYATDYAQATLISR
ncbi:MAG: hypothetical protein NDJ89_05940 [Oligoflexia bacterium]|nr:hypothetical protein [Oligoflexia bacterium]